MRTDGPPWWQRPLTVVAWLLSSFAVLVDAVIWRGAVLDLLTLVGSRRATHAAGMSFGWLTETLDWVMWLLIGIVGVGLSIAFEYYFRKGLAQGVFPARWLRVTLILAAVAGAGLLAQALI